MVPFFGGNVTRAAQVLQARHRTGSPTPVALPTAHCPALSQETRGWATGTVDLASRSQPSPLFALYPPRVRAAYFALAREARLLQRHWLARPPSGVPNVARLLAATLRLGEGDAGGEEDESARGSAAEELGLWAGEAGTAAPVLEVARASSGDARLQVRTGAQLPLPPMDYVAFMGGRGGCQEACWHARATRPAPPVHPQARRASKASSR